MDNTNDGSATSRARKRHAAPPKPCSLPIATGARRVDQHPIAELILLPDLQVRVDRDEETVRDYAAIMVADPKKLPPVDVFEIDGKLYLVNGWHRLNAALTAKLDIIKCSVVTGTMEDAWAFAWGANRTNGLRLTTKDKKHAIEAALTRHPDWSSSRIAELIGCTHPTVESYRKNLRIEPDTEAVDDVKRIGSDGKRRKVKVKHNEVTSQVAKILKASSPPHLEIVRPECEPVLDAVDQAVEAFDSVTKLYSAATDAEKVQIRTASLGCVRLLFPDAEICR